MILKDKNKIKDDSIRYDVMAFAVPDSGETHCDACRDWIPPWETVHQCKSEGLVIYTYRLGPDRTTWRRD
jgi:hypothetical protein